MKTLIIDGRLGADAEIRQTKTGRSYVRFSLANSGYSNGQNTTEWYDVTSFDESIINNRIKVLKKGSYVIVAGTPRTDVNVDKTNKVWVNQYVNAFSVELGASGKRESNGDSGMVKDGGSTYTGGTPSEAYSAHSNVSAPSVATVQRTPSAPQPSIQEQAPSTMFNTNDGDDDLPF